MAADNLDTADRPLAVGSERRHFVLAFAALVLGAVAMGASPIFVRLADVGPYASAFWRTSLALPFLWAWAHLSERRPDRTTLSKQDAPDHTWQRRRRAGDLRNTGIILAGLFFAGDLFFWHLAILATTVA